MKMSALVQTLLLGAALALPASALAQDSNNTLTTKLCKVDEVATFSNRVHVKCSAPTFPPFFASPTSNASEATRLVTLGSAALTGVGDLVITYWNLPQSGEASYGCDGGNCRRPVEILLK